MNREDIERLVRPHLIYLSPDHPLSDEAFLVELGLDSLGMVDVLVSVEEAFDIVMPDEFMTSESFATIGALSAAVCMVVERSRIASGP